MKQSFFQAGALMIVLFLLQPATAVAQALSLVPQPVSVTLLEGEWRLGDDVAVGVAPQLPGALDALRLLLGSTTGAVFSEVAPDAADIRIEYDAQLHEEAYRLYVTPESVVVSASTEAGTFYAIQTLRQLLPPAVYAESESAPAWIVPAVSIEDEPRFSWRGMHLDVARHFMPVEFVKKFIDVLAVHKFNSFHWHLTEDQGWRIEIKRYPKLTEIGSQRAQTEVNASLLQNEEVREYDGVPHGGFYSQEEIRDVVAYAARRHINVVPEIEFPGHAQAAIAAYPELGNTGEQLKVMEEWGISKNIVNPSENTLTFYRNVLTEVMEMFPSRYIHIGGDEVPKDQWEASDFAQQRIAVLGLEDEKALQSWLIQQMDDFLDSNGRRLIGWDEIMQGGLSSNATVMAWRGMKYGARAARAGHDVVMAPVRWTYFDFYQASKQHEPPAIGFYLPLRFVYEFEPVPQNLEPRYQQHILGAQGQLWTEFIPTTEHLEYMAFPRAAALAEVLWTPVAQRDFVSFTERLPEHLARLDALSVNYRPLGNDELTLWGKFKYWLGNILFGLYQWYTDL